MDVTLLEPNAALLLLAGVLTPLVTALFTKPSLSPAVKTVIAVIVSAVFGTLAAIISGQITELPQGVVEWTGKIVAYIALVVALGQAFYKVLKIPVRKIEATVGRTDDPPAPPEVE